MFNPKTELMPALTCPGVLWGVCEVTLAVLIEARKLISSPAGWAQHDFAFAADRRGVHPTSAEAVCWCSIGAVDAAQASLRAAWSSQPLARGLLARTLDHAKRHPSGVAFQHIPTFNDHELTTHQDVLELFDIAIAQGRLLLEYRAARAATESVTTGETA